MSAAHYRICTFCIMDSSDPHITFNQEGICNYCQVLQPLYNINQLRAQSEIDANLHNVSNIIKAKAKNSKYDCILGMSGGIDSSYAADIIVNKMNLNPLIIHFDNGWNSTIAVENIKKIISKLNLDMITYVIDWDEFRDLQRAFFCASVLDLEMLTDNAILGATAKIAKKYKIRSIISGDNFSTESGLPLSWRWEKIDSKNIKAIHQKYGTIKLKSFPIYTVFNFIIDRCISNLTFFSPLNFIHYKKLEAIKYLNKAYDWKYYGGKHYESVFTKFYQAYFLPKKFSIDKRKSHLSSLIRNLEITRQEALIELSKPLYDEFELKQDLMYVQKKLGFSEAEFKKIMCFEPRKHSYYPTNLKLINHLKNIKQFIKSI